jgi:hypothetical protein
MSVALFRGTPFWHCTHFYFYNQAHRPRLKALLLILYLELSKFSTGILNRFWIQVAVLLLKPLCFVGVFLYVELSGRPNGRFTPLLDPGGGFTSKTTARRIQKRNGRYVTIP